MSEGYKYRVLCEIPEARDNAPHFAGLGDYTAKTPDAACLMAAEAKKVTGSLIAVPVRSWHGRSIVPTKGFAIEANIAGGSPALVPKATVVVSGHGVEVELDDGRDLIADALEAAGVPRGDGTTWVLHDEGGARLPANGVEVGETVFLNPEAGGGAGGGER